jgi:hypothetical protein
MMKKNIIKRSQIFKEILYPQNKIPPIYIKTKKINKQAKLGLKAIQEANNSKEFRLLKKKTIQKQFFLNDIKKYFCILIFLKINNFSLSITLLIIKVEFFLIHVNKWLQFKIYLLIKIEFISF